MKASILLFLLLVKALLGNSNCSEASCHCNPIIQIGTESSLNSEKKHFVTVTSQLQVDQVKQICENVSSSLLAKQDVRFQNLLTLLDLDARPSDCQDMQLMGFATSGVYKIFPTGTSGFSVRCDHETEGGGWTVFQRRTDGKEDFYRGWFDYQVGFGNLDGEFWLGNQQLHMISSQGWYELRVDMILINGSHVFAKYNVFYVKGIEEYYRMFVDGYSGTAGDSLGSSRHFGHKFSTKDRDNDIYEPGNCAAIYHGAWWYEACHFSNLNGLYGSTEYGKGLTWHTTTGYFQSVSGSEMKVRRWTHKKQE
ncbi:hypothetical protein CHS0354_025320 [Potamilus streckersoni]|uniref:Fibrinogen C-terminal domain-containing protein n=1 Tax=Potamilus streckersoni TaxID=2493646 RepID=A0AAE0RUT1_9BIVA|nr:hypothetical protein CHS0354_025320 [Potamilus streckersoni]